MSSAAFVAKWELDPGAGAAAISLTGTTQNGLRLRRTLRLDGAFLRTETVLENASAGPVQALLQSRWDVDPGNVETVSVAYRKQGGGAVQQELIQPEQPPIANETYSGADQPAGEWRVMNRAGGPVTVNRFPSEQVARCYLNWTIKSENRVGMAVSSVRRTLQPGERLSLNSDYGVE